MPGEIFKEAERFVEETNRLYMAIGRSVVMFQSIEYTLGDILRSILQMREPEDRHRIVAAMSFRQKVDLVSDIYPARKKPLMPTVEMEYARKALMAAEEFRNSVVHSFWFVDLDSEHWVRSKPSLRSRQGLKLTLDKANIESIENGNKALCKVSLWYLGMSNELQAACSTLQSCTKTLSASHSDA